MRHGLDRLHPGERAVDMRLGVARVNSPRIRRDVRVAGEDGLVAKRPQLLPRPKTAEYNNV